MLGNLQVAESWPNYVKNYLMLYENGLYRREKYSVKKLRAFGRGCGRPKKKGSKWVQNDLTECYMHSN